MSPHCRGCICLINALITVEAWGTRCKAVCDQNINFLFGKRRAASRNRLVVEHILILLAFGVIWRPYITCQNKLSHRSPALLIDHLHALMTQKKPGVSKACLEERSRLRSSNSKKKQKPHTHINWLYKGWYINLQTFCERNNSSSYTVRYRIVHLKNRKNKQVTNGISFTLCHSSPSLFTDGLDASVFSQGELGGGGVTAQRTDLGQGVWHGGGWGCMEGAFWGLSKASLTDLH